MKLVVFIAVFTLPAGVLGGSVTPCEDNWVAFQGSCYLFGNDNLHFNEAQRFCEHFSSNLVHINDVTENTFLQSYLHDLKAGQHWIGLTDDVTENIWKWYDTDTVSTYFSWGHDQPNNGKASNCAAIWETFQYNWVDEPCTNSFKAICEKRPNTDTEIIG